MEKSILLNNGAFVTQINLKDFPPQAFELQILTDNGDIITKSIILK